MIKRNDEINFIPQGSTQVPKSVYFCILPFPCPKMI
uniref:Uncharacterized protein n=1 Tax=Arundo donax TaxID=35708 RepID=A0A0A9AP31_ARUDO